MIRDRLVPGQLALAKKRGEMLGQGSGSAVLKHHGGREAQPRLLLELGDEAVGDQRADAALQQWHLGVQCSARVSARCGQHQLLQLSIGRGTRSGRGGGGETLHRAPDRILSIKRRSKSCRFGMPKVSRLSAVHGSHSVDHGSIEQLKRRRCKGREHRVGSRFNREAWRRLFVLAIERASHRTQCAMKVDCTNRSAADRAGHGCI